MRRRRSIACVAGLLAVAACVDQGPGPSGKKIDPGYVRAHVLTALPAGASEIAPFGVTLEDKVIYLGNRVDKPRIAPGGQVTVTHYWQVVKPVGAQWKPFALVRAPAGSSDFMNLGLTDMQIAHGPATWKSGEIIEDVQTFILRPDWRSPTATLLVGLIEVGRHGTLDRMAVSGPHTQDRAIAARVLEVDLSRAPPPPGTVHVPRAGGAITIDGVTTDPGWLNAVPSPEFATAEGSPEPVGKATARMTWDDQYLYVAVRVSDTDIVSPYKQQDDPLWKADCIEMFIDGDGNRSGYVELQVSPNNVTFDSWFAGTRGAPGDEAWDSGMVTAVATRDSGDKGWEVELGIPWAATKGRNEAMPLRIPPQVGDRWKLNLVRVDKRSGNDTLSASSWNRITYRDFHALDRMLTAVFANPDGTIVPLPPVSPAGDGAGSGSAAPATGSGSAGQTSGSAVGKPESGSGATQGSGTKDPAGGARLGSGAMPASGSAAQGSGGAVKQPGASKLESGATPSGGSAAPGRSSNVVP